MADHNNGVQRHQAEVLEQLIENQRLDIEVRRAEVETKSKEIEANERIGLRSIEAQEKVQVSLGRRETTNILIRVGGFLLAFLFVLIFIGFAIKNDAKDIVIELMKYVVPLIIGGLGGFYIGKAKGKDEASGE
ncbi:hypothetical protein AAIP97_003155 [Klebsiella pneumoniae]|jgi:uncharacterized membrane protein|uniref:Uncharacterized protein n=5 Tax=Klebsiella pneumoniae TaxID=573 RepID=A0A367SCJ1_KLEPN|nr:MULTISPECIES: hypothetical protein [Klebsiella]EJK17229.1 hypothetical protein KPNIH19_25803 [Klebsiella pneumoniae subsp. pneumoniae KPNIH19]QBQ71878.1 hypothetical protein [Klebsiella phage ST512-KPC3phi13.3]HAJ3323127.1 hypothetical protein [Escherichia coli]HDH1458624.1 hypothetical protein [Klebsiella michiganensis]AIW77912.1 hypothetical protein KPNIH32_20125 [Klebsiella pneumoniae subsp. pneumoniae]